MIEIRTCLTATKDASAKTVQVEMDIDTALVLSDHFYNADLRDYSDEWRKTFLALGYELLQAANRVR